MTTVMSVLLPLYVFCTFLYCTIETDSKNEESNFQDESVKQNNIQLGGSRGSTAARFRIPKKFDVKGTKLDSLKAMLDERARWLEINKRQRQSFHYNFLWLFRIVLISYTIASILWIAVSVLYYARQRRKFRDQGVENTLCRRIEQERLLQRYNEIPSSMTGAGTTELLRADGLGPVGAGADESRLVSISDANQQLNADEPIDSPIMRSSVMSSPRLDYVSQFEVNRAKVEAVLKRNSEPQFMRRI